MHEIEKNIIKDLFEGKRNFVELSFNNIDYNSIQITPSEKPQWFEYVVLYDGFEMGHSYLLYSDDADDICEHISSIMDGVDYTIKIEWV